MRQGWCRTGFQSFSRLLQGGIPPDFSESEPAFDLVIPSRDHSTIPPGSGVDLLADRAGPN